MDWRCSRNRYLSAAERQAATVLYRALDRARQAITAGERDTARLIELTRGVLAAEPLASPDYVEVVDADSFETVIPLRSACLILLAVRVGPARLIDNMLVEVSDSERNAADGPTVLCSL